MSAVFEIVNEARQTCMIPCAVYGDQRCCKTCQNPCPDMLECRDKVGVCGLEDKPKTKQPLCESCVYQADCFKAEGSGR
jgi:hypothetical protein